MKMLNNQVVSLQDKFLPAHQLTASLMDLAISRGADKNRLMRGTGIFYEDIKTGSTALSASQLLRLIGNTKHQVAGYDSAFLLGRRLFPGNYGNVSNALLHSRHLADALRILNLLRMQICPFIQTQAYRDEGQYHLIMHDALGCGEHWQFLLEAYCTALVSASKLMLGRRIPFHFEFPFERPRYIQEYEENLGFRVKFSQPLLRIRVDLCWLTEPFPQPSQSLKWYAVKQARLNNAVAKGFLEAIRCCLLQHRQATLQQVAALFAMSPATFKRKLKLHGTCFQQLQDELGRQQAIYCLQVKRMNNEDTANMMEFTDVPNFRRAVKRWTGLTPSQLRLG
ncbi:AraC family transcriptional regulator ligand-binding domain-containing protein [Neptunicella sp. SCSIO 80796]|uniref:AraC family transcriptional regulator n=1 Tax=Neptunicella plasticusilytica TaxID=3117012 RepID=UPI003A4DC575